MAASTPPLPRIEDYALIGNRRTAALVGRDGSMDWLCLPRFDGPACFAALLGTPENGRWRLAPEGEVRQVRRRYREGTLILETDMVTDAGTVTLIDFVPDLTRDDTRLDVMRIVQGREGMVPMTLDVVFRFDYGRVVPWVRRCEDGLRAIAGPDGIRLRTPVPMHGENFHTCAAFTVSPGQRIPFTLTWFPAHQSPPPERDPFQALADTESGWRAWSGRCRYHGPWAEAVRRSLVVLKALTYDPTGGIVAAPTTSLPEIPGGLRNWDYRYCWLRDSTFTLYSLLNAGYVEEAVAWRQWLLRAVAGQPWQLQIMYGLAGERRLEEYTLPWLDGFAGSQPVRVGNQAFAQLQLDVFGEVLDTFHVARKSRIQFDDEGWRVERALVHFLETVWDRPDHGLWEVRGPPRPFTHSRIMAWVALDRAVKAVEQFGLDDHGHAGRWRALRATIHREVCERGWNPTVGAFTQFYGSDRLDAALLHMPLVGFLPACDPRVVATVEAIQRELMPDGLVLRYATDPVIDGLPSGEGAFLACSFWLADCLALMGRSAEARALFERLLALRNDVGLLAEEYDPVAGRQLGNFPQAFSHVALINTARNLQAAGGPAESRSTP